VVLVFANKQDVANKMAAAEIAQELNLHTIKSHPWHIQGCCAISGDGLHEGLDWVTQKCTS
jgi:ADP-ribosylation factor-like protein 5B